MADVFDLVGEAEEREAAARTFFRKYDTDGSGAIDQKELPFALAALGVLDGMTDDMVDSFVENEFQKIDADQSGTITFEEFVAMYNAAIRAKETAASIDCHELKELYYCMASFKTFKRRDGLNIDEGDWLKMTMGKDSWCKMCKDAGYITKSLSLKKMEALYNDAKARGEKELKYVQFQDALGMLAEKKGMSVKALVIELLGKGGLSSADIEARAAVEKAPYAGKYATDISTENMLKEESITAIRDLFEKFCNFQGSGSTPVGTKKNDDMEEFKFVKLCRDCSILDSKLTEKGAVSCYKKVMPQGQSKMNFVTFLKAVSEMAAEKHQTAEELMFYLSELRITAVEN